MKKDTVLVAAWRWPLARLVDSENGQQFNLIENYFLSLLVQVHMMVVNIMVVLNVIIIVCWFTKIECNCNTIEYWQSQVTCDLHLCPMLAGLDGFHIWMERSGCSFHLPINNSGNTNISSSLIHYCIGGWWTLLLLYWTDLALSRMSNMYGGFCLNVNS